MNGTLHTNLIYIMKFQLKEDSQEHPLDGFYEESNLFLSTLEVGH